MAAKVISYIFNFFLIGIIIFAPLFYGSLDPLPLSILQISTLLILVALLLKTAVNPSGGIIFPAEGIFLLIFLGLIVLQLLPLPCSLIKIISPKTIGFYQRYLTGFAQQGFCQLSIYPFNTKQELIKYVCFFSIFFVALNTVWEKKQFERLFSIAIIWAALLCLYGIMRTYFVFQRADTAWFSSFGNRNSFASYMILFASLGIGYSVACTDKFKKILFGFLGAFICASIFLSLSRAGALSMVCSLALIFLFLKEAKKSKGQLWIVLISIGIAIAFIAISGFEPLKNRFFLLREGLASRISIMNDAIHIVRNFPLFGVGLGNFHIIFTAYRKFVYAGYFYYLHNDHLQLILETGLFASLSYYLFLFTIFKNIIVRLKERHDPFVRSIVISGMCGLWGVLLHNFVDFNFHIPAVAFSFWLLLGLLYKCVHVHFNR
ncbi:MAG: O-antigen ligase family protein [Candidatus Omnitrophica bacterium]|nr:O-antigen ligase family protein [Candidatus Omnitrophota bacterium]